MNATAISTLSIINLNVNELNYAQTQSDGMDKNTCFLQEPQLRYKDTGPSEVMKIDITYKQKPREAGRYTHIRWNVC